MNREDRVPVALLMGTMVFFGAALYFSSPADGAVGILTDQVEVMK